MAYRVIKTIKGRQYIYEQESRRVGEKVMTKSRYIGPLDPVHRTARAPELRTTILSETDVAACLRSRDFERFAADPRSGRYPVAHSPAHLSATLDHARHEIFLSAETMRKVNEKHPEVSIPDFQQLNERISRSEIHFDRKERHRVLIVEDDGIWWRCVIKLTAIGELYLQTYHRSNARQIGKIKGRGNRAL